MSIPKELWHQIFIHLKETDLFTMIIVNKSIQSVLKDNNFWVSHNDNYKYAKFDIYQSIYNFLVIQNRIKQFLSSNNDNIILFDAETVNLVDLCEDGKSEKVQNYVEDVGYDRVCVATCKGNEYCILVDGFLNRSCQRDILFVVNKLSQNNQKYVNIVPVQICECNGHMHEWSPVIYGNYIWCIVEKSLANGNYNMAHTAPIEIKIIAHNILTCTQHIITEFSIQNHDKWANNSDFHDFEFFKYDSKLKITKNKN